MKSRSWISFSHLKNDLPAGLVVFLVALPLCMGIALASKAPLMSGIIAGIVGGIVVGLISNSQLSVSGPAAGLTAIVIGSLAEIRAFVERPDSGFSVDNVYNIFLSAVIIAGVMQVVFGLVKAGAVGNYIPSPVIKGMLAAIGIILILKQIPHALGYDADYEGDESFEQAGGDNTFTTIVKAVQMFKPAALIITLVSMAILGVWEIKRLKKLYFFQLIPGALIAVIVSILLNTLVFPGMGEGFALAGNHLASIPPTGSFGAFFGTLTFPDFSAIGNPVVWKIAITIALIASLESLLSVEAVDKLDPEKHISPKNRELIAQGTANIVSPLMGGLPVTAVIVRSSANVSAGAKTRVSAIFHGLLLLVCVIFIAPVLNLIPLAALAGVLFFVGYKLTTPKIIKSVYVKGRAQFIPFVVTIIAILFTDLLVGIMVGLAVGIIFTIRTNLQNAVSLTQHAESYMLKFKKDLFFMSIKDVKDALAKVPNNSRVLIDTTGAKFIDPDIIEIVQDFTDSAGKRGISVEISGQLSEMKPHKQQANGTNREDISAKPGVGSGA
ncbi:MAG TPA: SulP family inorganic anion transporter [Bacteroidia bacterium]|nr:SulP family inorganic anion transporter [Bacteroidia bacterium]